MVLFYLRRYKNDESEVEIYHLSINCPEMTNKVWYQPIKGKSTLRSLLSSVISTDIYRYQCISVGKTVLSKKTRDLQSKFTLYKTFYLPTGWISRRIPSTSCSATGCWCTSQTPRWRVCSGEHSAGSSQVATSSLESPATIPVVSHY